MSVQRRTKIELFKEEMKFSAGHFTIFSATHRENLHGHNFSIHVEIEALVSENGMAFDYGESKKRLFALCRSLNEIVLLPSRSPHLRIREEEGRVIACFADEELIFLKRDVLLLPIRNVTLEELADYLLGTIVADVTREPAHGVSAVAVRAFSGPGQSARMEWAAP
jgi:6-pyruvoyltetrahydropterin/6-carboxytetrahydropterin synthase